MNHQIFSTSAHKNPFERASRRPTGLEAAPAGCNGASGHWRRVSSTLHHNGDAQGLTSRLGHAGQQPVGQASKCYLDAL